VGWPLLDLVNWPGSPPTRPAFLSASLSRARLKSKWMLGTPLIGAAGSLSFTSTTRSPDAPNTTKGHCTVVPPPPDPLPEARKLYEASRTWLVERLRLD